VLTDSRGSVGGTAAAVAPSRVGAHLRITIERARSKQLQFDSIIALILANFSLFSF